MEVDEFPYFPLGYKSVDTQSYKYGFANGLVDRWSGQILTRSDGAFKGFNICNKARCSSLDGIKEQRHVEDAYLTQTSRRPRQEQ